MQDRFLTPEETAEVLAIPKGVVMRLLREGVLPGKRIAGRWWRVSERGLHQWLSRRDAPPDLLTPAQVGDLLDLSEQAVRHRVRRGEIPGVVLGKRLYIPKAELVDRLERQAGRPLNTLRKVLDLPPREADDPTLF
jgi:excisionase family DNA binding protein